MKPNSSSFLTSYPGTVLLVTVLCLSLALNIYQSLKMRGAFAERPPVVRVGDRLPTSMAAGDVYGRQVSVDFSGDSRLTVVYVLSPLCSRCKRNEANVKTLFQQAGTRFRFVGLSTVGEKLKGYVDEGHAPFPVYWIKSTDEIRDLHFGSTPQTLLVDMSGRVLMAWQGAYLAHTKTDIEKFFGVSLPGLQAVALASAN